MTDRVSSWRRVRLNLDLTVKGPPVWSLFLEETKKGVPHSSLLARGREPLPVSVERPADLAAALRVVADLIEDLR